MKYNRNQNSYEELQTIVEAQLETIEKLRTKLHKFKVLALDEETFNEAVKDLIEGTSEGVEETFKLPTKWKIKDCKEVSEYAHKRFGCENTIYTGVCYLHVDESVNDYGFRARDGYQEITMEQFLQFVYAPFLDSEGGEEKTEFTLDQNEIYSLEGATEEQRDKLLTWLKKNDIGWEVEGRFQRIASGIEYNGEEWIYYWGGKPTKYIKDLI